MELDWTTFILELINFVVLVWILNRFLYRPVMNVIDQRKAAIQRTLAEAETTRSDAQALQRQYENRVTEWEQEREKARGQLRDEIRVERNRLLEDLRAELDQEREKSAAVEQRRLKDFAQQAEATRHRARWSVRESPPVTSWGAGIGRKDHRHGDAGSSHLPDNQMQMIRGASATTGLPMKITSAYPLDTARREVLFHACRTMAGRDVACEFLEDRNLIAGVQISFGSWVLRANVQDEMTFFAASSRHA